MENNRTEETKFLLELYDEMLEADKYMPQNSPAEYAFCVPFCTLLNRLKELGVSDKRLRIKRHKSKVPPESKPVRR